MKIKFTKIDFIRRFGDKPIEVTDLKGAEYLERGEAIAITNFETPPLDGHLREEEVREKLTRQEKKSSTGLYPLIGWIQDTIKYGGAELSNNTVIEAGRRLGFNFYICNPVTFDKRKLIECDLLIINNFFFFEPAQFNFILDLIFEYKRAYIKYEHDHREIIGDEKRPKLARLLFGRSILNVFISPFHEANHRRILGDVIDPVFVLPPAIDTNRFKILPSIERNPNKMVNVTGRLYESKGFRQILQFAVSKPEYEFDIYTKNYRDVKDVFRKLKYVKVMPPVENDYLPKVYNSAGYTIHLPQALEACGRTIAEGVLCGCKPLYNKNVGISSFKGFHLGDEKRFNYDKFKNCINQGLIHFWKAVELRFYNREFTFNMKGV